MFGFRNNTILLNYLIFVKIHKDRITKQIIYKGSTHLTVSASSNYASLYTFDSKTRLLRNFFINLTTF